MRIRHAEGRRTGARRKKKPEINIVKSDTETYSETNRRGNARKKSKTHQNKTIVVQHIKNYIIITVILLYNEDG